MCLNPAYSMDTAAQLHCLPPRLHCRRPRLQVIPGQFGDKKLSIVGTCKKAAAEDAADEIDALDDVSEVNFNKVRRPFVRLSRRGMSSYFVRTYLTCPPLGPASTDQMRDWGWMGVQRIPVRIHRSLG